MKILYLAHRIPYPPDKGDKMRAFRHLAQLCENHDVWCAFFVDAKEDERHVDFLRGMCRDVVAVRLDRRKALARGAIGMIRGRTITDAYYDQWDMHDALSAWNADGPFDAVVAFSSSMAPYALEVRARRRVLDLCDLDSAKWRDYAAYAGGPMRYVYRLEAQRLAVREGAWARQFDATTVITEAEAADLRRVAPDAPVFVSTNGVEIPAPGTSASRAIATSSPEPARQSTVGFVGVMDYLPNVDAVRSFVDDCWWDIRARFPEARFRIVGRRPTRAVRRLARVPGVEIVGEVEDAGVELRAFDVSVAPLRIARGLQNKVLEAMAHGLPVVLSETAARGIGATDGVDYLVARGPDAMIRHIGRLLSAPDLRPAIGNAGRRFVLAHHDWSAALRRFELIVTGELRRTQTASDLVSSRPTVRVNADAIAVPSRG